MSVRLVVSNTVVIPVKGTISDEAGIARPFNFSLVCDRLPADEIRAAMNAGDGTITEFVRKVSRGWNDVEGEDKQPAPFSKAGLDQLLNIPGMAKVSFDAYFEGVGAKAKN